MPEAKPPPFGKGGLWAPVVYELAVCESHVFGGRGRIRFAFSPEAFWGNQNPATVPSPAPHPKGSLAKGSWRRRRLRDSQWGLSQKHKPMWKPVSLWNPPGFARGKTTPLWQGGGLKEPAAYELAVCESHVPPGCCSAMGSNPPDQYPCHKKDQSVGLVFFVVGEDGFEPSKRYAADLQSVPFGHSGTPPYEVGVLSEWSR